MKKNLLTVVKIIFIILLVLWMVVFVSDYFRASKGNKPFVCFSEETKTNSTGEYYKCISFGYKYFEYKETSGKVTYGFGAAFLKNEIEKNWEN